jgi:23S rRNA pseudouridine2605 synthase
MQERLQKFMARCGVASRRKAEEMIFEGRVKVNGETITSVVTINTDSDIVEVNGKVIKPEENKVYIMLNKPTEVITSAKDQFDRKTVIDLIDIKERIYPVGRLDYDTSGLLILTNDGDIAYKMTHPSHEVEKVYLAEVQGAPTESEMKSFREGLEIEDYITSPADIKIIDNKRETCLVEITIHEGRNRQVRKMCDKIGHPVIRLKRKMVGTLSLGELKTGEWRHLKEQEIEYLKSL